MLTVRELINDPASDEAGRAIDCGADVLRAIREPDPHAVAAVADALKMDATKVAAVWMLLIDEALK